MQQMRGVLVDMKKAAPGGDEQFKTCISTLLKYIGNVAKAPGEEKFRSIKKGNAAFQGRVAVVPGAEAFLGLCGFQVGVAGGRAGPAKRRQWETHHERDNRSVERRED
jgi:hypothetical protein